MDPTSSRECHATISQACFILVISDGGATSVKSVAAHDHPELFAIIEKYITAQGELFSDLVVAAFVVLNSDVDAWKSSCAHGPALDGKRFWKDIEDAEDHLRGLLKRITEATSVQGGRIVSVMPSRI